ncbi:MAG: hypothetical protein NTX03_11680 [Bacteroidetes bacterium]|nr:hypothetical protein [Bacteroidota bacterium]
MKKSFYLATIIFLFAAKDLFAQKTIRDTINLVVIGANYSFQIPGGDMAKRFGNSSTFGAVVFYKTLSNWLFGMEYNYLYGTDIREKGILDGISTKDPDASNRYIINGNGEFQILDQFERGHILLGKLGKVFPWFKHNPNSGISFKVGGGYMEHKIHYYWTGEAPAQLAGNYVKGYDRYTNGFVASQSVGLLYFGNRGFVNFALDAEVMEGFTKNRRSYNFDQNTTDNKQRLDLLYGLKLTWFFPVYHTPGGTYEYY